MLKNDLGKDFIIRSCKKVLNQCSQELPFGTAIKFFVFPENLFITVTCINNNSWFCAKRYMLDKVHNFSKTEKNRQNPYFFSERKIDKTHLLLNNSFRPIISLPAAGQSPSQITRATKRNYIMKILQRRI